MEGDYDALTLRIAAAIALCFASRMVWIDRLKDRLALSPKPRIVYLAAHGSTSVECQYQEQYRCKNIVATVSYCERSAFHVDQDQHSSQTSKACSIQQLYSCPENHMDFLQRRE
jgi:hypothetical protein